MLDPLYLELYIFCAGYCEYKGSKYAKGQTWDDGCSYTCTCIDDMSGRWQCDEK